MIYRTWSTSCSPMVFDFTSTYTYVWDYHGSWHWGSWVTLRCMPGYQIPANKLTDVSFFSILLMIIFVGSITILGIF